MFLLHFDNSEIVVKGKSGLANRGRLLIFARIDNEMLKKWVLIELLTPPIFFISDEVNVQLNFPNFVNFIVLCIYALTDSHFFELSFGVVPEIEVKELQKLFWSI